METDPQFTAQDYQLANKIIAQYKKEVTVEEQSLMDFQLYVVMKIHNQFLHIKEIL